MTGVEAQVAATTMTVAEMEAQLRTLLAVSTQTATSCKALQVTTEQLVKSHDNVSHKVEGLETQIEGFSARLTSLEGTIATAATRTPGSDGRGNELANQDPALERVLGNGTFRLPLNQHKSGPSTARTAIHDDMLGLRHDRNGGDQPYEFRMPKTSFPKFDGTSPKIWKEKAEKYFHMFNVPEDYKVDYATLHFTGTAALWLQTYQAQHDIDNWVQLCVAVCQKFGKDLYYTNMTNTLEIRQHGDVESYHREFELLMHQLLAHNSALDDTFFVAKFLKGLKREIRSALVLHKPRTVDAAISLALLHEAQLSDYSHHRYEPKSWHNQAGPGTLGPHPAEAQVNAGAVKDKEPKHIALTFAELKAQRRARGECFKCGGKYAPGHKCPQQVSLSVIEELCAALQVEVEFESKVEPSASGSDTSEEIFCLSTAATQGTISKQTLRLQGYIGKCPVLILVDSGSSGNFINSAVVDSLKLQVQQLFPVRVALADGSIIMSTTGISSLNWDVQQHKFTADVRVLKHKGYDIILGMEWLEECGTGKMWMDWRRKTMRFWHEGKRITLRGVKDNIAYCPKINSKEMQKLVNQGVVAYKLQPPDASHIHPVVQVSMLKQAIPANAIVQPDLPSQCAMIRWADFPSSWPTWENKMRLMQEFLHAPAWGQAGKQDGGNVTHLDQPMASEASEPREERMAQPEQVVVNPAATGVVGREPM